jgi:DNA invertase Pin-like site-specific DNA recombinase
VISLRPSTGHQGRTNTESLHRHQAMRDQAHRLGWRDEQSEVVAADWGRSAQSTAGRDGDNALLSEVAVGPVGMGLRSERTRLSRHGTEWEPLLARCAYQQGLMADRAGVDDPSTPHGRRLLGRKGIWSDVERHTRRGRWLAGLQPKAPRGDLALVLPAGLLRLEDGPGVKDPDLAVQHAMTLVLQTFRRRTSARPVVRVFPDHGLRLPRRHRNGETRWRPPPCGLPPKSSSVGTPVAAFRSSIAQPADAPIHASIGASRRPPQDLESGWLATPFL